MYKINLFPTNFAIRLLLNANFTAVAQFGVCVVKTFCIKSDQLFFRYCNGHTAGLGQQKFTWAKSNKNHLWVKI